MKAKIKDQEKELREYADHVGHTLETAQLENQGQIFVRWLQDQSKSYDFDLNA